MSADHSADIEARGVRVTGTVQGVGFRPFVYRLARELGLSGWVRNVAEGVEIHAEGPAAALDALVARIRTEAPPAARIVDVEWSPTAAGECSFAIIESAAGEHPTVDVSPDLPVCADCLREMADPSDRRHDYPYINCTNCGPRYSIIERLPYDRPHTTMKVWSMCAACTAEYTNPLDRRYHAQPIACPQCGPAYRLLTPDGSPLAEGADAVEAAAAELRGGRILAVKGLGGYHLACDARNADAVGALRRRKFRKEKPFAVMARDVEYAREIARISSDAQSLLTGIDRPIVLLPAREALKGVAPEHDEIGIMLPYAPLHVLLFACIAPPLLVMTSANRSSEPIAYRDDEALERLSGIADLFLVGERPIARRVDDSVARVDPLGPVVLRRSRGYAPAVVASLPSDGPILGVGADLKNAVALVVEGRVYVSQHVGDLAHYEALEAFRETIEDLMDMYRVDRDDLLVVHDAHPQYASTQAALEIGGRHLAVQHHRAHVASVIAEHGSDSIPSIGAQSQVLGIALDGTGYGDDASIWGGEMFVGSLAGGFERAAHFREARLPGGDAAAEHPVQAAAGFLAEIDRLPDLREAPFHFPERYEKARRLAGSGVRTFTTTSAGRLFDTAAALLGFTRGITFEGQAAVWLEQLAHRSDTSRTYPFPDLDFQPLLRALIDDVLDGASREDAALAFHRGLAAGLSDTAAVLCRERAVDTVVLSGGVFQNRILLRLLADALRERALQVLTNRRVPPNDGGICLGQAALAAYSGRT